MPASPLMVELALCSFRMPSSDSMHSGSLAYFSKSPMRDVATSRGKTLAISPWARVHSILSLRCCCCSSWFSRSASAWGGGGVQ